MSYPSRLVVLLCLLLLVGAGVAGGTTHHARSLEQTSEGPQVTQLTYDGNGSVNSTDGLVLWQGQLQTFRATVEGNLSGGQYELCLHTNGSPRDRQSAVVCETPSRSSGGPTHVNLTMDRWPDNDSGVRTVTAALWNSTSGTIEGRQTLSVTIIEHGGDADDDGLANGVEVTAGTDPTVSDTDDDGLGDETELKTLKTDPLDPDSDDDGLLDGVEIHEYGTSPVHADSDGDGLDDKREIEIVGSNPTKKDTDGDGLTDAEEVSTYHTNATRADTDGDSLPDGKEVSKYNTDPNSKDTDGDSLPDGDEIHVYGTDPTTVDTDGDGLSDRLEVQRYQTDPTKADSDGDGLTDGAEIRTYDTSPTSADSDGDGFDDGREVHAGTDPTDPGSHPDPVLTQQLFGTSYSAIVGGVTVACGLSLLLAVLLELTRDSSTTSRLSAVRTSLWSRFGGSNAHSSDSGTPDRQASDPVTVDQTDTTVESPALLTDEERVLQLLEDGDGRLHQSDIVEATDWSKSKVSRVLSRMAEDDQVSKITLGKENLITIPGEEPDGVVSPFSGDDS